MFLKLLIISALFVLFVLAGLALRILLHPGGKFPETHISRNEEMKKRGITCAQQTDVGCASNGELTGCASCNSYRL